MDDPVLIVRMPRELSNEAVISIRVCSRNCVKGCSESIAE